MNVLNLKSVPMEAVLCISNCHLPVWVKTAETDSKFQVCRATFARAPFFEQIVIPPGSVIYIDGLNRINLIKNRKRFEIQFGELPIWYYGTKLAKNQFAQLEDAQRALNSRKITVSEEVTSAASGVFKSAKLDRVSKFDRSFIVKHRNTAGASFDPDNHALWPERAPGMFLLVEVSRTR